MMTSPLPPTDLASTITCGDFAAVARRHGWTVDYLSDVFRGQIERPREFFAYAMQGQYRETVIPFRSVLDFYRKATRLPDDVPGRRCACGCRALVFDRRRWATAGCKKRKQRESVTVENRPEKPLISLDPNRDKSRGSVPHPSRRVEPGQNALERPLAQPC